MKRTFGVNYNGHAAAIRAVGWGEPKTIFVSCSCGWEGLTVEEKWFQDDEQDFSYFAEPFRTVARTYGPESTLREGAVFGSHATALVQVLEHLGYDPEADLVGAAALLQEATKALLHATTVAEAEEARRTVDGAANEMTAAVERSIAWRDEPRPVATVPHPEAVKLLAAHRAQA